MPKKTGMRGVTSHGLFLFIGLVGLSLILSGTASYGQTQKALIDLNSASEKELESIKGIGPAMAKKIIDGRPYKSVDELSKTGIPAKTIEAMKPLVKVGSSAPSAAPASPAKSTAPQKASAKEMAAKAEPSAPAPQKPTTPATAAVKTRAKAAAATAVKLAPGQKININKATKEQLEALPEIGPVKAQAIIDGRPYKKIDDVMKIKGIKEGTFGKIKDVITVE